MYGREIFKSQQAFLGWPLKGRTPKGVTTLCYLCYAF